MLILEFLKSPQFKALTLEQKLEALKTNYKLNTLESFIVMRELKKRKAKRSAK